MTVRVLRDGVNMSRRNFRPSASSAWFAIHSGSVLPVHDNVLSH
jgi:hypothetical protein